MAGEAPIVTKALSFAFAVAYAEGDRTDDARLLLAELAADDFEIPMDAAWLSTMSYYAEAAVQCRDPNYAGPLFDRLAPWVDQFSASGGSTAEGPVSHYLGGLATVLGRYNEADAFFTQAVAMSARMSAKFFAARTNLQWGKMLTERSAAGDIDKARALLTKAHEAAATNGYATVERRAAAALQHLD